MLINCLTTHCCPCCFRHSTRQHCRSGRGAVDHKIQSALVCWVGAASHRRGTTCPAGRRLLGRPAHAPALSTAIVNELVYADGPLAVASRTSWTSLSFNWKHVEVLPIRCNVAVPKPEGQQISCNDFISVVGSLADGSVGTAWIGRMGPSARMGLCLLWFVVDRPHTNAA